MCVCECVSVCVCVCVCEGVSNLLPFYVLLLGSHIFSGVPQIWLPLAPSLSNLTPPSSLWAMQLDPPAR